LEPTEIEDVEIVRRVLAGEEALFEVLVRRYQARVASHVTRMVGNRDDALDLAQEIFLKVFQALDRFNPAYKFSTWLFRIAGNAAIDHLRKRRPRTVPLETPDPDGPGSCATRSGARPSAGPSRSCRPTFAS
jgi:RNA polymerase sigma-70 factor (ECF subfamily)